MKSTGVDGSIPFSSCGACIMLQVLALTFNQQNYKFVLENNLVDDS